MKTVKSAAFSLAIALVLSSCATDEFGQRRPYTNTEKGAAIGAAGGAILGAAVSKDKRAKGAIIGAVGGGLAGGLVGNYMDNQRKDLEKVLAPERNAGAIQIDELQGKSLRITMTNQTAFDVNSTQIKPGFYSTLDKISSVVNQYGKTTLTIVGHTDDSGSDAHNQTLSEQRAQAVQSYFLQSGVNPQRLSSYGAGERQPRANNATEQGKQLNRRVEIIVEPVVAQ